MESRANIVQLCSEANLVRRHASRVAEDSILASRELRQLLEERHALLLWTAELLALPRETLPGLEPATARGEPCAPVCRLMPRGAGEPIPAATPGARPGGDTLNVESVSDGFRQTASAS